MTKKHNPLEQFEIQTLIPIKLGDLDISFTNSSAFMALTVAAAATLMILAVRPRASVPGRWQLVAELCYGFIAKMVLEIVGDGVSDRNRTGERKYETERVPLRP